MLPEHPVDPAPTLRVLIQTVGWDQRKGQGLVPVGKKPVEQRLLQQARLGHRQTFFIRLFQESMPSVHEGVVLAHPSQIEDTNSLLGTIIGLQPKVIVEGEEGNYAEADEREDEPPALRGYSCGRGQR